MPMDNAAIAQAASPEDIAAIRELFEEYQRFLGFDLCFQGFPEELAGLPGKYGPPEGRLLLARAEGKPAGCVALYRMKTPPEEPLTAEIKRLYVRPAFARMGLGRRLFAAVLEEARAAGYARVRLDSLRRMEAAGKLYKEAGFYEIAPYNYNPEPDVYYLQKDWAGSENEIAAGQSVKAG